MWHFVILCGLKLTMKGLLLRLSLSTSAPVFCKKYILVCWFQYQIFSLNQRAHSVQKVVAIWPESFPTYLLNTAAYADCNFVVLICALVICQWKCEVSSCSLASCSSRIFFLGSVWDRYQQSYFHRLCITHWTWLNMWPVGLISYHVFFHCLLTRKGRKITQALPRQRIWKRIEILSMGLGLSTKQIVLYVFYLFCSSLPPRSCSQCASITQCLIFLSINQRKIPCVRHALWVSARLEWIHIYSWEPMWNCLIFELAARSISVWFTESKGHNRRP